VIAYFDTSAVIPLIIEERSSATFSRIWNLATRVVSVRLVYVEARAALAMAAQIGRLTSSDLEAAVDQLDALIDQVDRVEVNEPLVQRAGSMAHELSLRGYDAVHLAAAHTIADSDMVFVSGDRRLTDAATHLGLAVAISQ